VILTLQPRAVPALEGRRHVPSHLRRRAQGLHV